MHYTNKMYNFDLTILIPEYIKTRLIIYLYVYKKDYMSECVCYSLVMTIKHSHNG